MRLRLPLVIILVLVVQLCLLDGIQIHGAHPDAMLLLGIAAGMARGPERGAAVGFAAGLLEDMFVPTPIGFSALAFTIVGFAVGTIQTGLIRPSWWLGPLTAIAASAVGVALFALIGAIVGQGQMLHDNLPAVVVVVSLANGVLAGPMVRLVSWSMPEVPAAYPGT